MLIKLTHSIDGDPVWLWAGPGMLFAKANMRNAVFKVPCKSVVWHITRPEDSQLYVAETPEHIAAMLNWKDDC